MRRGGATWLGIFYPKRLNSASCCNAATLPQIQTPNPNRCRHFNKNYEKFRINISLHSGILFSSFSHFAAIFCEHFLTVSWSAKTSLALVSPVKQCHLSWDNLNEQHLSTFDNLSLRSNGILLLSGNVWVGPGHCSFWNIPPPHRRPDVLPTSISQPLRASGFCAQRAFTARCPRHPKPGKDQPAATQTAYTSDRAHQRRQIYRLSQTGLWQIQSTGNFDSTHPNLATA